MKTTAALTLLSLAMLSVPTAHAALIESFGTDTNTFTMTFVPIGNPGNAADTTGEPNPAGSVGYAYNMGKYEVSRDMVNKANASGNLGITLYNLDSFGGNGPNRPATGVNWNEAARYVNWLNTSQGFAPAYKFTVQPGQVGYSSDASIQLWQVSDMGYNAGNPFRNSQAKYFLPSMNEWHKATFYDPSANGGMGGYWNYPNGSDMAPTSVSGGTAAGTAVWWQQGPADIDSAGGLSPYGVMGLGGNVWELQETQYTLGNSNPFSFRGLRGGNWAGDANAFVFMSSSNWDFISPTERYVTVGFRVASIPEPSSAAMLTLATVGLWQRRKRLS